MMKNFYIDRYEDLKTVHAGKIYYIEDYMEPLYPYLEMITLDEAMVLSKEKNMITSIEAMKKITARKV